tara:strand:- start:163 stop:573 length:411 start_codon:yes stop_codon:yes gene_type:complete
MKLADTGITYPNPDTLPKPILGFRLCKLIQYPDNDAWLFTSAYGTSIAWRGKSIAFSTWVPGQTRSGGSSMQISGWLNEANGWDDESLLELVKEGVGFLYIHESGDKPPMTVSEYTEWVAKQTPQVQPVTAQAIAG